jgi:hypothetical protein
MNVAACCLLGDRAPSGQGRGPNIGGNPRGFRAAPDQTFRITYVAASQSQPRARSQVHDGERGGQGDFHAGKDLSCSAGGSEMRRNSGPSVIPVAPSQEVRAPTGQRACCRRQGKSPSDGTRKIRTRRDTAPSTVAAKWSLQLSPTARHYQCGNHHLWTTNFSTERGALPAVRGVEVHITH